MTEWGGNVRVKAAPNPSTLVVTGAILAGAVMELVSSGLPAAKAIICPLGSTEESPLTSTRTCCGGGGIGGGRHLVGLDLEHDGVRGLRAQRGGGEQSAEAGCEEFSKHTFGSTIPEATQGELAEKLTAMDRRRGAGGLAAGEAAGSACLSRPA